MEHKTAILSIEIFLKYWGIQYVEQSEHFPTRPTIISARKMIQLTGSKIEDLRARTRRKDLKEYSRICEVLSLKS